MCLKPALNPMRVLWSWARVETRVDMWDEIEDREKKNERRVAKNGSRKPSPKIRRTELAMSTHRIEHRPFTKGWWSPSTQRSRSDQLGSGYCTFLSAALQFVYALLSTYIDTHERSVPLYTHWFLTRDLCIQNILYLVSHLLLKYSIFLNQFD